MARKLSVVCLTLVLMTAAAAPALAEDDPMSPVALRKHGFSDMGAAFKAINDQMKRPQPVMVLVKAYAQQLARYAREPVMTAWFPAGSGPAPGVKTAAKAEIWTKPDEFRKLWAAYGVQADKLVAAAAAKDPAAVRQAVKDAGGACAACHRVFRTEER